MIKILIRHLIIEQCINVLSEKLFNNCIKPTLHIRPSHALKASYSLHSYTLEETVAMGVVCGVDDNYVTNLLRQEVEREINEELMNRLVGIRKYGNCISKK